MQQFASLLLQGRQLLLERQVGQAARAMEQMNAPGLPRPQLLTQHGQQRRDAHARADQHQRARALLIQREAAHRRPHVQHLAGHNVLMQIPRSRAWALTLMRKNPSSGALERL
jgi:hypothetical protein